MGHWSGISPVLAQNRSMEEAVSGSGLPDGTDAAILRDRVQAEGVFFETGGFTFSDERSNRNHIRLGYSVIGDSLIAEGIDKIAKAVPDARVVEPASGGRGE